MEQIRARVDAVVKDPKTAAALKPYYPYGCKRPTFHDEYLPAFNLPHVHLVDTAPTGVKLINERGVVHDGVEYPLDVLIYATGFEWMGTGSFNMIRGRAGRTLREKWESEGTKTFLGMHSAGFPNLFIMNGPQGGGGQFNFTRVAEMHAHYIVWALQTVRARGAATIDVTQEAEDEYARHCAEMDLLSAPLRDCLSYYNGDGTAKPGSLAYYGGGKRWHDRREAAQKSMSPYRTRVGTSVGSTRFRSEGTAWRIALIASRSKGARRTWRNWKARWRYHRRRQRNRRGDGSSLREGGRARRHRRHAARAGRGPGWRAWRRRDLRQTARCARKIR